VVTSQNGELEDPTSAEFIEKAQQGKVTGIIFPPPDIRAIVDKTAQFVAKHGKSFEMKIMSSAEGNSAKFNFMRAHDPYNAYYEFKIREFEVGGPTTKPKPVQPATPDPEEKTKEQQEESAASTPASQPAATSGIVKKRKLNAIAAALTNKITVAPPAYQFTLVHPTGLSCMDMDIIKLTAQYTAVSGRQFLAGLAQRENRNPQFDFLKPTHMLFNYFTSLVDAYSKVLAPTEQIRKFGEDGTDDRLVLERVVQRWEWTRQEEERRNKAKAEDEERERLYQSVDWHDFVVVETIDFPDNEMLDMAVDDDDDNADDMDMDMEDDKSAPLAPPITPAAPTAVPPPPPAMPPPPPPPGMENDEEITVIKNYRPQLTESSGHTMPALIDPITKRAIPVNEMAEHMRIQLLDPKWLSQQKTALLKNTEETLAEGDQIAQSLQSFAKQRGDIFGSAEDEEQQVIQELGQKQKGQEELGSRIIWDGHSASVHAVQQESIARLVEELKDVPEKPSAAPPPPRAPSSLPPPSSGMGSSTRQTPSEPSPPILSSIPSAPPPVLQPMTPGMAPPMPLPPGARPPIPGILPPAPPMPMPPMQSMRPPIPQPIPHTPAPAAPEPEARPVRDMGTGLLSEADYAKSITGDLPIKFALPADPTQDSAWNLNGALVDLNVNVMMTIKELKAKLSAEKLGGMPPNKFQLKSGSLGFLKDRLTVAHFNIKPNEALDVLLKTRGGRR